MVFDCHGMPTGELETMLGGEPILTTGGSCCFIGPTVATVDTSCKILKFLDQMDYRILNHDKVATILLSPNKIKRR